MNFGQQSHQAMNLVNKVIKLWIWSI